MWVIIAAGFSLILAFVFSFAKVSSRAEKITDQHRAELQDRKEKNS